MSPRGMRQRECWKSSAAGLPASSYPAYLFGMVSHEYCSGSLSGAEKPEKQEENSIPSPENTDLGEMWFSCAPGRDKPNVE